MNPIFVELLKKTSAIRPFLEWYTRQYPNGITTFQNLPFSHQIGVYLEYFETMYKLVVIVTTRGFTIHFTNGSKSPIDANTMLNYHHHKFEHSEPKSIIYGYQLGIIWLFENYDVPF